MFWIELILRFVVWSEWIVVLWLEFGFFMRMLIFLMLCFVVWWVVDFVVMLVVYGVDLWEFLKFMLFDDV